MVVVTKTAWEHRDWSTRVSIQYKNLNKLEYDCLGEYVLKPAALRKCNWL
jgi:hypothetical protein